MGVGWTQMGEAAPPGLPDQELPMAIEGTSPKLNSSVPA